MAVLRELKVDEAKYLKMFDVAQQKGNEGNMRTWHRLWKSATEDLELLAANPRKFVSKRGWAFDIKPERKKFLFFF